MGRAFSVVDLKMKTGYFLFLTLNLFRLSPLLNVSSVGMFHEYTVLEHWNNKSMMCKIICLNGTVLTSYSSLRQSLQSSLRHFLNSFT